MWDPKTISALQLAAGNNDETAYWKFANHANEQTTKNSTLRGLMKFKFSDSELPLEEVEPEKEIVKRFATGAMSAWLYLYGSGQANLCALSNE